MEILSQSITIQSSSSHSKQQADEVVFLYRVVPGSRACNSYGAWCASIAGIPAPIVQRGKYDILSSFHVLLFMSFCHST